MTRTLVICSSVVTWTPRASCSIAIECFVFIADLARIAALLLAFVVVPAAVTIFARLDDFIAAISFLKVCINEEDDEAIEPLMVAVPKDGPYRIIEREVDSNYPRSNSSFCLLRSRPIQPKYCRRCSWKIWNCLAVRRSWPKRT